MTDTTLPNPPPPSILPPPGSGSPAPPYAASLDYVPCVYIRYMCMRAQREEKEEEEGRERERERYRYAMPTRVYMLSLNYANDYRDSDGDSPEME